MWAKFTGGYSNIQSKINRSESEFIILPVMFLASHCVYYVRPIKETVFPVRDFKMFKAVFEQQMIQFRLGIQVWDDDPYLFPLTRYEPHYKLHWINTWQLKYSWNEFYLL